MSASYLKLCLMKRRTLTKRRYLFRSLRLLEGDAQLWTAAAANLGVSQSDFLRSALREKAQRIFRRQHHNPTGKLEGPRPAA